MSAPASALAPSTPRDLSQLLMGRADVGQALVDHPQVALVSATGSTRMGQAVGPRVAARFGRSLLELGGNNAIIVAPSADLDMAVRAVAFAAAGTAGPALHHGAPPDRARVGARRPGGAPDTRLCQLHHRLARWKTAPWSAR